LIEIGLEVFKFPFSLKKIRRPKRGRGRRKGCGGGIPPRPSVNFQKSASGFSRKKVRILSKRDSQLVKFRFPASLPRKCGVASADEFSSNFQGFLYSTKTSRSRRSGFEPIFFRKFFLSEKFPCKAAIWA